MANVKCFYIRPLKKKKEFFELLNSLFTKNDFCKTSKWQNEPRDIFFCRRIKITVKWSERNVVKWLLYLGKNIGRYTQINVTTYTTITLNEYEAFPLKKLFAIKNKYQREL